MSVWLETKRPMLFVTTPHFWSGGFARSGTRPNLGAYQGQQMDLASKFGILHTLMMPSYVELVCLMKPGALVVPICFRLCGCGRRIKIPRHGSCKVHISIWSGCQSKDPKYCAMVRSNILSHDVAAILEGLDHTPSRNAAGSST
jgi:hypothetical protein